MEVLKNAFVATVVLLLAVHHAKGQSGLQVEFERGMPVPADSILDRVDPSTPIKPLDDQSLEWRLPRHVMPFEYDLKITPILPTFGGDIGEDWAVPGEVVIKVDVLNATDTITLHSLYTDIHDVTVTEELNGTDILIYSAVNQAEHSFFVITLNETLEVGIRYQIRINFTSEVQASLEGLYRSSYLDPYTNETKWLATTQMEALNARQMFPCFDEPAFKAVFYMTIGRRAEHIALTNAASLRNATMVGRPGWIWETFNPTVKMSTFLLAVIISEFTFETSPGDFLRGTTVRTYAPAHYIDLQGGVYAADKAARFLEYFQNYYKHDYPLSKMDSAAVPDFFFGAMENYGLNIYRESALLYFPAESTEAERFTISRILSHELAHQWFGNYLSPRWWTHIWLSEGFATYVSALGVQEVAPEFDPWERFINDAFQYSMGFDAQPGYTHSVKINEEAWISKPAMGWFDRIAYEKAGSLIRMMNMILTEPVFQQGLINYLTALAYSNALQDDLFYHLNEQVNGNSNIPSDLTVKDIMDSWTLQPGLPLVRVAVFDPTSLFVSQERFSNNDGAIAVDQDPYGLWFVPMSVATPTNPRPTDIQWIYNDTSARIVTVNNTNEWVIVNSNAVGFYRVLYDASLTQLLKQQLELDHTALTSITRSQLLDDYFNAAWQKFTNIETALDISSYLGKETEIVVWNTVFNNLRRPFNLLSSTGAFYASLRGFLHPRVKSAAELTGGLDASFNITGGMPVIRHLQFLDWLCALEDPDCIALSLKWVNDWRATNSNTIFRDFKPVVYCAAVANGDDSVFNFVLNEYRTPNITVKQQTSLLNALACAREVSSINALLEGAITETFYNKQSDGSSIFNRLAMNPLGRGPLVRFLRRSTDEIIGFFNTTTPINSAVNNLATYVSSATELEDIKAIYDNPQVPPNNNALTTIQQNIQWVAEFAGNMNAFFSISK